MFIGQTHMHEWRARAGRLAARRSLHERELTPLARKAFPPWRQEPRASRVEPAPTRRKRPESQRSSARAAGAMHTRQPLAGVRQPRPDAAHSRAEPEEPRRSAGTPQTRAAPSKSRAEPVGSARASGTVPKP